jgi:hypothetical protein
MLGFESLFDMIPCVHFSKDKLLKMFYSDDDYKTYTNRILLAVDGFFGLTKCWKTKRDF